MIQEQYVSFETAKLLKEKGFYSAHCKSYYFPEIPNLTPCITEKVISADENKYLAPTQQMAMRWLREVHKLHIKVGYDIQLKWYYDIISLKETVSFDYEEMKCYHSETDFDSYEQAVKAAIKYCLENLILQNIEHEINKQTNVS